MKHEFRLGSKTKISIIVNDAGDQISFDFADPSFLEKAQTMIIKANELEKEFQSSGEFLSTVDDENIDEILLSEDMLELGRAMTKYFNGLREAIDLFLGAGASQKVFGDDNYMKMFDDLFEALKPYIDLASERQEADIKEAKKAALKKIPQDKKRSL